MRIIINHLTRGSFYPGVFKLAPAFAGTFITLLYQFINLYGLFPGLAFTFFLLAAVITLFVYTLHVISFFFLPLPVCGFFISIGVAISFTAWFMINFRVNRRLGLRVFRVNFSSYTAFLLISLLLCHRVIPLSLPPQTDFWEIHLRSSFAGRLKGLNKKQLTVALQKDYLPLQGLMVHNNLLFGCTPGNFTPFLPPVDSVQEEVYLYQTIISPDHARVFGLKREFFFHVFLTSRKPTL